MRCSDLFSLVSEAGLQTQHSQIHVIAGYTSHKLPLTHELHIKIHLTFTIIVIKVIKQYALKLIITLQI